jgi:alanine dehydrogenase
MPTLVLTKNDVQSLLDMADVISAVEKALIQLERNEAQMPPKAYLVMPQGDFRAMPSALPDCAGIKWVNVHPRNKLLNLPTVMGIIVYSNPNTGYPLAIMDATEITAYRTGATAAIASKYLAPDNSRTLGIVGAGQQAYTQILAHMELFTFDLIKAFDISETTVEKLIKSFPAAPIKMCSLEDTIRSDIVCTLTPTCEPFIKREWITTGIHINAVGADAEGKEELDPDILRDSIIVVDNLEQAGASGEINVPLKQGLLSTEEVYGTLGEIICGSKEVIIDENTITVFDSTGLAVEDLAVANLLYSKAMRVGGYLSLNLVDE